MKMQEVIGSKNSLQSVIDSYDKTMLGRGYKKSRPVVSPSDFLILPYYKQTNEGTRYFNIEINPDDPEGDTFWEKKVEDTESQQDMIIDSGNDTYEHVLSIASRAEVNEVTSPGRRKFLKTTAATSAMATPPGRALTRRMMGGLAAGQKPGGYIWNRLGDTLDRKFLTGVVDRIVELYPRIGTLALSDDEIREKINSTLRRHIPKMTNSRTLNRQELDQWRSLQQDLLKELPLPEEPDEWNYENDDRDYDEYYRITNLRDSIIEKLATLSKVSRDANLGSTENYGYKVFPKLRPWKKKDGTVGLPTDPTKQVAQQSLSQAAAAALPKTPSTPAISGAVASLKKIVDKLVSRNKSKVQGVQDQPPAAKTTPALPAPDKSSADMMADLRDLMKKDKESVAQTPKKDKD